MREAGGFLAGLVAFLTGQVAAWLLYRRRLRHLIRRMQARAEHRIAERERRFAVVHDGLLQDLQGLALSLQAAADQLPPDAPVRRRLEQVLDRTDELLAQGRQRMEGAGAGLPGPD